MKDKMSWEETIIHIRTKSEYKNLVREAYFEEELHLNVERFRSSPEFTETIKYIKQYQPKAKTILDIGSGNGISAISFALEGYDVVTVEPDPSDTIGAGAIRELKKYYRLTNIEIYEAFAEEIKFDTESFDIVYARQCMHHAYDLQGFVKEAARVLKKSGMFFTVRDHIVFNQSDKEWFLETHPLQKYYGGENAFSPSEYKSVMKNANLDIKEELKYYDSIINFFPITKEQILEREQSEKVNRDLVIKSKLGLLSNVTICKSLVNMFLNFKYGDSFDETKTPGRMYSYIAIKKS